LSFEDNHDARAGSPPPRSGPWGPPAPERPNPPLRPTVRGARNNRTRWLSVAFFVILLFGVGARAYRDLSRPEAWAYWRDLYFSPSMTSSLVADAEFGGPEPGRPALAISGTIGPAAASWFRDRLDEAHLAAGDAVLLSSPGGDLNQAIIMGEVIRARGLVTAVGVVDASNHVRPSYCASACVLVYAGGKVRIGVDGSRLGVHRFVTRGSGRDPVAETQRTQGALLGYMTKMGVSASVVEAMSATSEVRWLGAQEAAAMNLVTEPAGKP
jgi:membrane-bound ClpP family serine protease